MWLYRLPYNVCAKWHICSCCISIHLFLFFFPFITNFYVSCLFVFVSARAACLLALSGTNFLALAFMVIKTLLRWLNVNTIIGDAALLWETHLRKKSISFMIFFSWHVSLTHRWNYKTTACGIKLLYYLKSQMQFHNL